MYSRTSTSSLQSQVVSGSSVKRSNEVLGYTQNLVFSDFANKVKDDSHNSTFQHENGRVVPGTELQLQIRTFCFILIISSDDMEMEKWMEEKKKLLDDYMAKEGETEFLRQQLQQIRMREENDKREKMKQMEELNQRHEKELNEIPKDKDKLNSQIEFLV